MGSVYIEDSVITIPNIKDSIHGLGDLWDCHRSKASGFNLFAKHLKEEHLIAHPIKTWDYSLTHVKNTADIIKNVHVSGSLKLELLGGLIAVEASAGYTKTDTKSSNEERLMCKYNVESYSVELLPLAKEVMDMHVTEMLIKGKIHATHVVRGVVLGGEVNAQLSVKQVSSDNTEDISGSIFGKMVYGPINASVKASLKFLDSEKASNYEKQITIHSKPPMRNQPSSIKEMFEMVESIDQIVSNEQHFKMIGTEIQGVPIRFILVPINQFLDMEVEKLYLQLKDDIMEDFRAMLTALHDFRLMGYIKSRVIDKDTRLRVILSDFESKLTRDIAAFEKPLKQTADNFFKRAFNALEDFRCSRCKVDELLEIVNDFAKSNYSVVDVEAKVENFIAQGKMELRGIHDRDAVEMKADIIRFTNQATLSEWLQTETKIKMLLNTQGSCPDGVFRRLFEISSALTKVGIEIGVALPSISDGFALLIKVEGDIATHKAEDIPFVLGIVCAIVGINQDSESYFHALSASLFDISLPLEGNKLNDINSVVSTLCMNRAVYITRSLPHSLQRLTSKDEGKWKFFVCLDAIDTSMDAIEKLKIFMSKLSFLDSEWIAGSLGFSNMHAAPLLFAFRNAKLEAICYDNLDLLILVRYFELKDNSDLSILSPDTSILMSFYPDRARFALEVVKLVHQIRNHKLDSVKLEMPSFNEIPDQRITDALKLARDAVKKSIDGAISTVASNVVDVYPELEITLKRHGWSVASKKFNNMNANNWKSLCSTLEEWLMLRNPLLAKVESALMNIKLIQHSEVKDTLNADKAIESVVNDKSCPNDMKTEIWQWEGSDIRHRYVGVANILEQFTLNPEYKETYLHVMALITLLKQITDCEKSSNSSDRTLDVYEILPQYIDRISSCLNFTSLTIAKIKDHVLNRRSFQLVTLLAKYMYGSRLIKLHLILDQLNDLNDIEEIVENLMKLIEEELDPDRMLEILKNSKFQYLILMALENKRFRNEFMSGINSPTDIPDDIPYKIAERLKSELANQEMALPETFTSFKEMYDAFEVIMNISSFPQNFQHVLTNSLAQNEALTNLLRKADVLFHWNDDDKSFYEQWDLDTIKSAIGGIHKFGVTFITEKPLPTNITEKPLPTNLYSDPPYTTKNLIKNPNGEQGTAFWTIEETGGNGWVVESPPISVDSLVNIPEVTGDSCFATSYRKCSKSQIVNLSDLKISQKAMDEIRPPIIFREYYAHRIDCASRYSVRVSLYGCDWTLLDEFNLKHDERQFVGGQWHQVEHVFSDYPKGVQLVKVEHFGHDLQGWAGHYGSKITGSSIFLKWNH